MANRKASFNGLTDVMRSLTDEEQVALVDNADEFKQFAAKLVIKEAENIFFTPLSDQEVPEKHQEAAAKWRKLAAELGYTGPVAWKVREGFTLKTHAPKAGPCYQNFGYLQDWNLKNDEATKTALVFFIPRLVEGSKRKNVPEQMEILSALRTKFDLPAHHLASFGSAAMLSGLILAHFKRTGERTPLNKEATRTDTLLWVGLRLYLYFGGDGLYCDRWDWGGDGRSSGLGCFPLGVELGN